MAPVVAAVFLAVSLPAGAQADDPPRLPQICQNEATAAQRMNADVSALEDGVLRLDGRSVVVDGPDADWQVNVVGDGTFTMRFHSMAWLVLAAQRGYPSVDLLLEREAALPDPGHLAEVGELRATGWTQSAVWLRMGVVGCLYRYTQDARLLPVIERLVLANADPFRYRGQPFNRPHNHGTLANLALLEAFRTFARPEWRDLAFRRLDGDAKSVFSDCGMSAEQSTTYHLLNVQVWERSLAQIEDAADTLAGTVRERIGAAALASVRLTRPDGVLEAVGDGNEVLIDPAALGVDVADAETRLWCSRRGWAANRSSWDDSTTHYTLRFGPRRTFHGHVDRGSLTWFTQGVPVFSDRGLYDKTRGARYDWAQSMAAHSTFEPVGATQGGFMKARDLSAARTDVYHLQWSFDRTSMTREISIPLDTVVDDTVVDDSGAPPVPMTSLHVSDVGKARGDRQWMQHWQLSPEWTPLPRATAWEPAAIHAESGLYLYGTCWSGLYMRPTARAVESYPQRRTAVPATSFECGGLGREVKMDTLWVVSPLRGLLSWDRLAGDFGVSADDGDASP